MRGNFLDVPTDCPQRDERLGWTGDLQVFAPTRDVPVRRRRLPRRLARRPPRRAARRRRGADRRAGRTARVSLSVAAAGATPRPCVPWTSTSATATPSCWRSRSTACGRGSTSSGRRPATGCCGRRSSSSATGSIPTRRPTSRGGRRPTRARRVRVLRPLGAARQRCGRGARPATTSRASTATSPPRAARRSARVRHADRTAQLRLRHRDTRSRSCSTSIEDPRHRARAARADRRAASPSAAT